jgi:hypothetical protein
MISPFSLKCKTINISTLFSHFLLTFINKGKYAIKCQVIAKTLPYLDGNTTEKKVLAGRR